MEGPRDPTETVTELCLSVSCGGRVSSGLLQGQDLWVHECLLWRKGQQWTAAGAGPLGAADLGMA